MGDRSLQPRLVGYYRLTARSTENSCVRRTDPSLPRPATDPRPSAVSRTRDENDTIAPLVGRFSLATQMILRRRRTPAVTSCSTRSLAWDGVIHRAIDTAFGREVAVKVLQERFAPTSAAATRFLGEARITGQLQHPAIPPAHDLGTLHDGRPFLAMKLIRGDTLDNLLKARPDPAADRGRFVAIFEQVCQAVAYAHDHRVIHRDLKPANVMVGNYGEVQVMDWGLAKVLGGTTSGGDHPGSATDEAVGTEILSRCESDGSLTQAGSLLGTPAYIPPEQAVGEAERIDERADVFGLGAVLAVILTGEPPYVGKARVGRLMAIRGELEDAAARLDASWGGAELVAL